MRLALTLGEASSSSYCGISSIRFAHLKSHIASQGVQRKVLYDEPLVEQHDHCRFYPHNLGKHSYLFLAHHLQRLGIQGFDNPSALLVLDLLSNSGVTPPCRELGWLFLPQQTWQLLQGLVSFLWAYLVELMKSLVSFLGGKVSPLMLAYPCETQKSWLSLLAAKLGYQSYSFQLNQVVCPYLILPQTGVGCKP